jgi:hypothetical protein
MNAFLTAGVIDRSGLLPVYSAIVLCCTSQTAVAEGLLLEEWPSLLQYMGL